MTFTFEAEVRLLRWSESSTAGRTITLEIPPDAGEAHPFRGLPTGHQHGQRFRMAFIAIDDNEEPAEPMQVLDPTTPDGEPFPEDEEPRDPPSATVESRPPDTAGLAPQPYSGPGGAIHDNCPHDWYRDRCQICGARADTAAELGGGNPALSGAERRRYAAFLRSVRDYPTNPDFVEWVSRKVGRVGTTDEIASYIKWRCGVDTRLDIKTDDAVCEKFLEMEAEFDAETPGRLAERRG